MDRDENAAINILKRSRLDESVKPNAAPLPGERSKLRFDRSPGKRKRASEAHPL
jgi:hypothetical protein